MASPIMPQDHQQDDGYDNGLDCPTDKQKRAAITNMIILRFLCLFVASFTKNRGADAYHRRAFFDRDFKVVCHAHRQFTAYVCRKRRCVRVRRAIRGVYESKVWLVPGPRKTAARSLTRSIRVVRAVAPSRPVAATPVSSTPVFVSSWPRSTWMSNGNDCFPARRTNDRDAAPDRSSRANE